MSLGGSSTQPMTPGLKKSTLSAFVVMTCTFVSRLLGFVRIAVITGFFGAGGKADILNLTFSIPNNFRKLLAEGALSAAFIPVLSASLVNNPDGESPKRIVRNILTFQLIILIPVCILSIIFAEPLVRYVLAEFKDPAQIALSGALFRWFINYLLLISVSALLMGVLNSHSRFFIPAVTPILFSIAVISSIVFLSGRLDVYSMAIGVLAGGILQIVFQYPLFRKLGYRIRIDSNFRNPEFKKIMRQWLPVLATSSIFVITQQIALRFASGLEDGSVTAVTIALTFYQLPFGIFSASVTTVLFPRMSRQAAGKDTDGLRDSFQYGLRFLLVFLVPSAIFLCLFNKELISVAFQRELFSPGDTLLTSRILYFYAIGLFSVGAFTFVQRFFYSLQLYRIPFFTAVGLSIADIVLSLWLKETELRAAGIALANSVSFSGGLVALILLSRSKLGNLMGKVIFKTTLKVCISNIAAICVSIGFLKLTGEWWLEGSSIRTILLLSAGVLIYAAVTLLFYRLLGIEMLRALKIRSGAKT